MGASYLAISIDCRDQPKTLICIQLTSDAHLHYNCSLMPENPGPIYNSLEDEFQDIVSLKRTMHAIEPCLEYIIAQ